MSPNLRSVAAQTRSRRQLLVMTSSPTKLGRDLKSMSRPQISPNLQQPLFPGRNPAMSYPAQPGRDAKFRSRPKAAPQGFQPCRDLKSRLRPRVALQLKSLCHNLLKTNPGRDLKSKLRPGTQKSSRVFNAHVVGARWRPSCHD